MRGFTTNTLAWRGVVGHARQHAAVAAGVAVATAVLVGALVVGDSVRWSLRSLTLDRLGDLTHAIAPGRPFREALADAVAADNDAAAAPLVLAPASLSRRSDGRTRVATGATLVGFDERFLAAYGTGALALSDVPANACCVTRSLAAELGVSTGDRIVLRADRFSALPPDSALGDRDDTVGSRRLAVHAVLDAEPVARFGLAPSQQPPRNVFVPLSTSQRLTGLDADGSATVVVLRAPGAGEPTVRPTLDDYGLSLAAARDGVWQLQADRLVLPDSVVTAAKGAWGDRPTARVVTYLANAIETGDASVPYSLATAVRPSGPGAAALVPAVADLGPGEVALNDWAADRLVAEVGDAVTLRFYEPESTHGELREASPASFRLVGAASLIDSEGAPTDAADPELTPQLEGVTDAESIERWDLPFELAEPIGDADEAYWDERRTTPKAFVSYDDATRLWGTRWGDVSLVRVGGGPDERSLLASRLLAALPPESMAFAAEPVRERGLAASAGATPFDVLVLLFSLFLIAAALLLVMLLVWLTIDSRARGLGLLGAVGFNRGRVRATLRRELTVVVASGVVIGAMLGVGYAALLLALLRTVWLEAIVTPFLRLHVGLPSIAAGAVAAGVVAWLTVGFATRAVTARSPRSLLAGCDDADADQRELRTTRPWLRLVFVGVAIAASVGGATLRGEAAAGAFFAAGAATIAAAIAQARLGLASSANDGTVVNTLGGLAVAGLARRPQRALLVVGLIGGAVFLLLATSAFLLPPTAAGSGGFTLVAEADRPLPYDVTGATGRWSLGFAARDEETLSGISGHGFRVRPGADGSCRNLYQGRPEDLRIVGAPPDFIREAADSETPFAWAAVSPEHADNPWAALEPTPGTPIRASQSLPRTASQSLTPIVLDANTAVYALKLYGGVGQVVTLRDESGLPYPARVVGLLKNSLLQGSIIMSERALLKHHPSLSGPSFFLLSSGADADLPEVIATLEDGLVDYGFDAAPSADQLAGFLAVQNTYLSTFQALGGLGLALGVIGLAVAQYRNLLERRGELALLRAGGFSLGRLRRLTLRENLTMVGLGGAVGLLAALVTLTPLVGRGDVAPPWATALAVAGAVAATALGAGWLAVRAACRGSLTSALRAD